MYIRLLITITSFWSDWSEVPLFVTMARGRLLDLLIDCVFQGSEELSLGVFFNLVSDLRIDGSLRFEILLTEIVLLDCNL